MMLIRALFKHNVSSLQSHHQQTGPGKLVSCAIGHRMVCLTQAHLMLKPACSPCPAPPPPECVTPPFQYFLYTSCPVLKRNRNIIKGHTYNNTTPPNPSPSRERSSVHGQLAPWAGKGQPMSRSASLMTPAPGEDSPG